MAIYNTNPYAFGGVGAARLIDDSSPWISIQQKTLPKVAPIPPRGVTPPQSAPLPKGLLPVAYVDPIITGVPVLAAPSAPGTAVATIPKGGAVAGCLSCGALTPPANASVTNAGGSGSVSGGVNTASLLTATSSDVPWWLLIVGAAVVGYAFRHVK